MITEINEINTAVRSDAGEFVKSAEKDYHDRIMKTVDIIKGDSNKHIILLAGPSASGKTTSAHIMRDYLLSEGIKSEIISLDDFYKTHDRMPKDESGNLDYESVYSLEVEDIKECFGTLLSFGKAKVPVFDFKTKMRKSELREIDLGKDGVVIVEGLHALNPVITEGMSDKNVLRLYISVVGEYYKGNEKILCSREIRLMRRMSRDMIYRNSPPEECLKLWSSVIRGEDKYLCPFRNTADMQLASFHDYELCAFKTLMLDTLKSLPSTVENYESVKHIASAMELCEPLDIGYIPEDSLMKEFMAGGKYE